MYFSAEIAAVAEAGVAGNVVPDEGELAIYYDFEDPDSGKQITDRQLELRLHTVGLNAVAKRQAQMVMAAYPLLLEEESAFVLREPLSDLSIPISLHDSLMARLDRLVSAKGVAQLGATIVRPHAGVHRTPVSR